MDFEWDETKNKANQKKHNIGFEQIIPLFYSENSIYVLAKKIDKESRAAIIGQIENKKVFVCIYTSRGKNIRIISARRARKKEEELWLQNQ